MKKTAVLISVLFTFVFSEVAVFAYHAPVLYFGVSSEGGVGLGTEFSVEVKVNSDQPLNVYSLSVIYPADLIEFVSFNNAGSLLDLTRSQPKVFKDGRIQIEGGSLKSFSGEGGLLGRIVFRGIKPGEGNIVFENPRVYLANGKGTKITPNVRGQGIRIVEQGEVIGGQEPKIGADTLPPRIESLLFIDDPVVQTQKLLGFIVKDDGTGIKEVLLSYRRWFWWTKPIPTQNPAALPLGVWSAKLIVKDNTLNVNEAVIYDWGAFVKYTLFFLAVAVFVAVLVINRVIRRKRL